MEVYRSQDDHVAKYVHDDGSETSIKTTPIQEYGGVYGSVKNKFNIFISVSVGCKVGCKFCYLTTKKCPTARLTATDIAKNVAEAVANEFKVRPKLKNMYAKLSWMGMGDAYRDDVIMLNATKEIIRALAMLGCKGIDGVDVSTTIPYLLSSRGVGCRQQESMRILSKFIYGLGDEILNPERDYHNNTRHPVRFFYSLHSADEATRRSLIPYTARLLDAGSHLLSLQKEMLTIIIHHMFFKGVNDSDEEVTKLIYFMEHFPTTELRLLRFNRCEGTSYVESDKFDTIVQKLLDKGINVKVQSSPGSEVKAACGQFLLSKIKGVKNEES